MNPLYNNSALKEQRRELRKNATPAEIALWGFLKECKLMGRRFRRQYSIGYYIVDFYCAKERLVIELDGALHFTAEGRDMDYERDAFLKSCDVTILRFENYRVLQNVENVLDEIKKNFKE